jgi:hypothetical protein
MMKEMKKRMDKMPNWAKYTLYTVLGIAGAFLLGLLFGNLIMWLWNWLMPSLFGLRTIGFWEGLGLFLLAKILFGFGGSSGSGDGDKKHHHGKRHHHHHGEGEKRDWKDWEYYDDWWEEDGKTAFHAYAERMKKEPEDSSSEEKTE